MKKSIIMLSVLLVAMVAAGGIAMACGNTACGNGDACLDMQIDQSSGVHSLDMQTGQSSGIQGLDMRTASVTGLAVLAGAGLLIGLLRTILT